MQSGSTPTSSSNSRRKHLETELAERQRSYDALTERIQAISADPEQALDSEQQMTLQELKKELIAEQEEVVVRMAETEKQLAPVAKPAPPPVQAKELERAVDQPASPVRTETLPSAKVVPLASADYVTVDKPIRLELVRIPAGYFLMGTRPKSVSILLQQYESEEWYQREVPQHQVYLPDFYIGRVPVTVAQFRVFFEATGYQTTAEREGWGFVWKKDKFEKVPGAIWRRPFGPESDVLGKDDYPVTLVSWHDARAFCEWAKVRLPSEAEWEKAACGTDGLIFPWGNQAPTPERCNFGLNVGNTTPVDKYPKGASPFGILDMAGNVREWTSSLSWKYPYDSKDGREDPKFEDTRVLRGGSFLNIGWCARCASRVDFYPRYRFDSFGFRVCVSPGLSEPASQLALW